MSTIFILLIMTLVFWYLSRNKKRDQERRQAQRDAAMVPGTWMVTTAGYYGRFVDRDGDVVILENLDGQETLWSLRAIVGPSQPPFAQSLPEEDASLAEAMAESDQSEVAHQSPDLNESADQTVLASDQPAAENPAEDQPATPDSAPEEDKAADGAAVDTDAEADSETDGGVNPDRAET